MKSTCQTRERRPGSRGRLQVGRVGVFQTAAAASDSTPQPKGASGSELDPAREVLMESRTQLMNAVRGLSKAFAGRLQKRSTARFTAKLAGQVPEAIRGAVAPLLETIAHLNEQIRHYDQREEHMARERYPKYRLLEQVNGVGVHTALSFMLTIGDPERFEKSREVGSFLGMRPKKKDSGDESAAVGHHQSWRRVPAKNTGELRALHFGTDGEA
jgi:transposase